MGFMPIKKIKSKKIQQERHLHISLAAKKKHSNELFYSIITLHTLCIRKHYEIFSPASEKLIFNYVFWIIIIIL